MPSLPPGARWRAAARNLAGEGKLGQLASALSAAAARDFLSFGGFSWTTGAFKEFGRSRHGQAFNELACPLVGMRGLVDIRGLDLEGNTGLVE